MKIGNFAIPQYRLIALLNDIKKIYEQFKSEEVGPELIAHTLNQAPRGGAFLQRMADLRSYGLIDGRGSKIRVTELGKLATYGSEQEKAEALDKILKNIPLWSILFDKYGSNIKEDGFWIDLVQITGAERPDALKAASNVRNAYISDVKNLMPIQALAKEPEPEKYGSDHVSQAARARSENMDLATKDAVVFIKYPNIGTINLDLNDETNLKVAETILNIIRVKLRQEKADFPSQHEKSEDIIQ